MHCPSCGAPAAGQPKFCRSCGFNLEKVAQLLAEPPPPAPDGQSTTEGAQLQNQLRRTDRWLSIFLTLFIALICGGITWAVVVKMMIGKGQFWTGLGLLLFVASAAVSLFLIARREDLQEKLADKPARPPAAMTNRLLSDPPIAAGASVTEPTTRQLAEQPINHWRQR